MAEEHRCQAPQLCANNCGFFGSPATHNLCSKCFQDLQLKEQQSSSAKLALNQSLISPSSSSSSNTISSPIVKLPELEINETSQAAPAVDAKEKAAQPNRCSTCRRRVGLTGFKCRCGMTCCGTHRYPEQHGCSFDFKAMGREQIAKANPVVKGEKLEKI